MWLKATSTSKRGYLNIGKLRERRHCSVLAKVVLGLFGSGRGYIKLKHYRKLTKM